MIDHTTAPNVGSSSYCYTGQEVRTASKTYIPFSVGPSLPLSQSAPTERSASASRAAQFSKDGLPVHSPICVCRWCSSSRSEQEISPIPSVPRVRSAALARSTPVDVITGVTLSISRVWDPSKVLLGVAALDWLTLTSYDHAAYRWLVELLGKLTDATKRADSRLMQYRGCAGEGFFFGDGMQSGRVHYMVRLSASLAHQVIKEALAAPAGRPALAQFHCTRVDVQYTHPEPLEIDLSAAAPVLREAEWPAHRGKKPKVNAIDDADGLDTLYIGKRKESNRFQRAYMKVIDEKALIRWEVEYKEQLASLLWEKLLSTGLGVLAPILAGELDIIPLPEVFTPLIKGVGADPSRLYITKMPTKDEDTLRWLWRTVSPALRRVMSSVDDKVREGAKEFLELALLGEELPVYLGSDLSLDRYVMSIYRADVSTE